MATVEVKDRGRPETDKILQHIKQLQATVNEIQTSMNKLVKKRKVDIDSIAPTIAAAFDDVDFIKQVCYENDTSDVVKLLGVALCAAISYLSLVFLCLLLQL